MRSRDPDLSQGCFNRSRKSQERIEREKKGWLTAWGRDTLRYVEREDMGVCIISLCRLDAAAHTRGESSESGREKRVQAERDGNM